MKNIKIFCFGFGQVAKNFITKLSKENFDINLSTTSRSETSKKKIEKIEYTSFKFNNDNFDPGISEKIKDSDYILISVPPKNKIDYVFKNFSKMILTRNPKWVTYLSATSVYGDHKGNWVNEESKTKPTSVNGLNRLKAEKLWQSLYQKKKLQLQIFRLSGIYSNENNALSKLKLGNAKIIIKKNHFFSRIHVEDIANILFNSLSKFKSGEIFNVSDDCPESSEVVTLYGAKILGLENPKIIKISDLQNEKLRNFYNDSKKVSNKKMKSFFDYSLRFPTYTEGLDYIRNNFF